MICILTKLRHNHGTIDFVSTKSTVCMLVEMRSSFVLRNGAANFQFRIIRLFQFIGLDIQFQWNSAILKILKRLGGVHSTWSWTKLWSSIITKLYLADSWQFLYIWMGIIVTILPKSHTRDKFSFTYISFRFLSIYIISL